MKTNYAGEDENEGQWRLEESENKNGEKRVGVEGTRDQEDELSRERGAFVGKDGTEGEPSGIPRREAEGSKWH